MTNDVFFREVNEEMRQERMRRLATRYGVAAGIASLLIVLAVGAYVLWERHRAGIEAENGDRLIQASTLLQDDRTDEALPILESLAAEGTGVYPHLARLRIAEARQRAGDPQAALAGFDAVAEDSAAPANLRDMAAIRAGYILVDTGSLDDVRSRVERLTGDAEPLRYLAREAVGLAAWRAGDIETARPLFTGLEDDFGAPAGLRQRATLMSELIAGATPPAEPEAPAQVPGDAAPSAPATDAPAATDVPLTEDPAAEAPALDAEPTAPAGGQPPA